MQLLNFQHLLSSSPPSRDIGSTTSHSYNRRESNPCFCYTLRRSFLPGSGVENLLFLLSSDPFTRRSPAPASSLVILSTGEGSYRSPASDPPYRRNSYRSPAPATCLVILSTRERSYSSPAPATCLVILSTGERSHRSHAPATCLVILSTGERSYSFTVPVTCLLILSARERSYRSPV
jgi:hypothetical protein